LNQAAYPQKIGSREHGGAEPSFGLAFSHSRVERGLGRSSLAHVAVELSAPPKIFDSHQQQMGNRGRRKEGTI
jgi:hypothetical protein